MKVTFGIREYVTYQIFEEHSDDDGSGGIATYAETQSLDAAEMIAKALSEAHPGSTWFTVPKSTG